MTRRGFSNVATPMYVIGSLNNTDTSNTISVSATPGGSATTPTGWPGTLPFFAALDYGVAGSEEVVLVTAASGSTLTITRGGNLGGLAYGSATRAHSAGATIIHAATAADVDESNAHVNSATGVHGVSGTFVGTTDVQTLSNKTLSAPIITDFSHAAHDHSGPGLGGTLPESSVVSLVTDLAGKAALAHTHTNADLPAADPRGAVTDTTPNVSPASTGGSTETMLGPTFSGAVVSGRRYEVWARFRSQSDAGSTDLEWRMRYNTASPVTIGSNMITQANVWHDSATGTGSVSAFLIGTFVAGSTGTYYFQLSVRTGFGTGNGTLNMTNGLGQFLLKDIGT